MQLFQFRSKGKVVVLSKIHDHLKYGLLAWYHKNIGI